MRRPLRLLTVVMAVCFVCAAALAQTTAAGKKKKPAPADGGVAPAKLEFLPATKAMPMPFRDEPVTADPAPTQAVTPQQVAPPEKKK